jgi:putative restriction endonuclease
MTDFSDYNKHFIHLNRAPGPTWTDATNRKAPHKPILLLAVLDLVHRGIIISPFIDVTGDLVELNELFNLYWLRIIPLGQSSSIAFPFSRLDREPFRDLVPQPGKTITPAIINNTSSVTYLRKYALGVRILDLIANAQLVRS